MACQLLWPATRQTVHARLKRTIGISLGSGSITVGRPRSSHYLSVCGLLTSSSAPYNQHERRLGMTVTRQGLLDRINHLETGLQVIRELDIDDEDWCLVGSSVLSLYNIRQNRDLDVCIRSSVYRRLLSHARDNGWTVRPTGTIVISGIDFIKDEYRRQGITSEDLLDNPSLHQKVAGVKVARAELEFAKRAWARRQKDLSSIPYLEAYALSDPEWDWSLVKQPRSEFARQRSKHPVRRALRSVYRRLSRVRRIVGNRSVWPTNRPADPLLLSVILWPPAQPFFDVITEELAKQHTVESYDDFELDSDGFAALVRRIYAYERLDRWRIERKVHFMASHKPRLRHLNLVLQDPVWTVNEEATEFISMASLNLKKRYRRMYQSYIPDYVHDVIMHTGDTHEHCQWLRETLQGVSAPLTVHALESRKGGG